MTWMNDLRMNPELNTYVPICQAIAGLLHPHAEVVLHDLGTGNIGLIVNPFSKRRAGDSSMTEIDVAISLDTSVIGPYRKTNWDRRQLRSVTSVLRDLSGKPIGLLCVNLDITAFEGAVEFIRNLIQFSPPAGGPSSLFKSDWKETAGIVIDGYFRENNINEASMTKDDHLAVLSLLDDRGIFAIRNSVPHVAEMLQLSRATVYKVLKSVRERQSNSVTELNV